MIYAILYGVLGLITSFTFLVFAEVQRLDDDTKYLFACLTIIAWPVTLAIFIVLGFVGLMTTGAERVAARFK